MVAESSRAVHSAVHSAVHRAMHRTVNKAVSKVVSTTANRAVNKVVHKSTSNLFSIPHQACFGSCLMYVQFITELASVGSLRSPPSPALLVYSGGAVVGSCHVVDNS